MEVKAGHCQIKEFHFHIYWFQQNCKAESEALAFKEALIEQVKQQNFIVVCEGIDEKILPALKSPVPKVNRTPRGPHPCGSFEVWCPRESLAEMLSFTMLKRGSLSVLIHPLGRNEVDDHTVHKMWLGEAYPIDVSLLNPTSGDEPQYSELKLGYSK